MEFKERETAVRDMMEVAIRHHRAERLAEARTIYQEVLDVHPDHADALHLLGLVAHQTGDHAVALDMVSKALAIRPRHALYLGNLGEIQRALGRHAEAEASLRAAVVIKPDDADVHTNLGYTLRELRRLDEAERSYQDAIRVDPSLARAKLNYALLKLLRGDYAAGFELFEARFAGGDAKAIGADRTLLAMLAVPRWRGDPIPGKSLLLWGEQGLGDSIMMMRYLPLLRSRGVERFTVYCHAPLFRLMQTIDGPDEVISRDEPLPAGDFDCHCPMMSLPHLFGTRLESIPNAVPYLHVPEWLHRKWAARFHAVARPRIGLAWASGRITVTNRGKSIQLESLAPLLAVPGARFVSLQKDGGSAGPVAALDSAVLDWMGECEDLLETAAVISQLDLVISVDTAVAHLAGALGKSVWLLNRYDSDWRWTLDRSDSPWYPTMTMFRQAERGNWDGVIRRASSALGEMLQRSEGVIAPIKPQRTPVAKAASRLRAWLSRL